MIDASRVQHVVAQADFGRTVLHGMLGLLLFAGALHINIHDLAQQRWSIAALSLGGTLISTVGGPGSRRCVDLPSAVLCGVNYSPCVP